MSAATLTLALAGASLLVVGAEPATAAPPTICGTFDRAPVSGGSLVVQNNAWGQTSGQCVQPRDGGFTITKAEGNLDFGGAPKSYPSIFAGEHYGQGSNTTALPVQVSKISDARTSARITKAPGAWDAAWDIWVNSTKNSPSQDDDTEVMVWADTRGGPTPIGDKVATITVEGRAYDVWQGKGAGGVDVLSYVDAKTTTTPDILLGLFLQDAVKRGATSPDSYVTSVQFGFEPWKGGAGLAVDDFTYTPNGATPTAPATPEPAVTPDPSSKPDPGQAPATAGAPVIAPTTAPGFVALAGGHLSLGGKPWRFTGANAYWLGLDDNIRDPAGQPTQPTHYRIDNALDAAAGRGATVVRSTSLGVSLGCPVCFNPAKGVYNEHALDAADYAIAAAGARGLRLAIPLGDQWRFYHGGLSTFTARAGHTGDADTKATVATSTVEKAAEAYAFTDPAAIADQDDYMAHVVDHVNPLTGLAWKDDPTIAWWQIGNEEFTAPDAWTGERARHLKEDLGVKQLVADGSCATGMRVADSAVASKYVDIACGHFYPVDVATMTADAKVAADHGKAYVIDEYAWTDIGATTKMLAAIEADPNISGDLYWNLMPHLEDGTPEPHDDGYALWDPATDARGREALTAFAAHSQVMNTAPGAGQDGPGKGSGRPLPIPTQPAGDSKAAASGQDS